MGHCTHLGGHRGTPCAPSRLLALSPFSKGRLWREGPGSGQDLCFLLPALDAGGSHNPTSGQCSRLGLECDVPQLSRAPALCRAAGFEIGDRVRLDAQLGIKHAATRRLLCPPPRVEIDPGPLRVTAFKSIRARLAPGRDLKAAIKKPVCRESSGGIGLEARTAGGEAAVPG